MPIDTARKRRGVAGIGYWLFGPGVTPDATPDVFWRQSVGWGYGGIVVGAAVAAGAANIDTNSALSVYLQAQYVGTWAGGQPDLNTLMKRRLEVTATSGEMTARMQAAIKAARESL